MPKPHPARLPRLKIAHQLALLIVATVALAVLAVGGLGVLNLRSGFRDYLQARDAEQLMQLVALVEQRSANDPKLLWLRNDAEPIRALMDEFNGRAPRPQRRPAREQGLSPLGPPAPDGPPRGFWSGLGPPPPHPPPPGAGFGSLGDRLLVRDAMGQRIAGRPLPADAPRMVRAIKVDGEEVAFVELRGEPEREGVDARFLQRQTKSLVLAATGTFVAALLIAWWLAARWSGPLRALQRATRDIALGRRSPPLVPAGAQEIAQLMEDVNSMAAELERLEKTRRVWIAQISHELRTPLSVLRGEMEAIEDGARQPTPDVMAGLRDEVLQLNRRVDDLHTLSMADMGALPCTFTDGDAHARLWRMAQRFVNQAEQRGLTLATPAELAPAIDVCWDFDRIEQLVANLLRNSMLYTDAPGSIRIDWHNHGHTLTLSVNDSPPGVSSVDLTELFEPLFRGDRARQRHLAEAGGHGSGLGLSIVRSIAHAHGGNAVASASAMGGLQVTVTLALRCLPNKPARA